MVKQIEALRQASIMKWNLLNKLKQSQIEDYLKMRVASERKSEIE